MTSKRKRYTPQFKTQAVLELLEGDSTLSEVASKFDINPTMLSGWRKQFLENAPAVFEAEKALDQQRKADEKHEAEVDNLNRIIGSLTVERDYLRRDVRKIIAERYQ